LQVQTIAERKVITGHVLGYVILRLVDGEL
jgi:hypothetical protein